MPPNKPGRKPRTRGKNVSNVTRERTVLTLAEDPTSAPPYMLPSQTPFTPTLGNIFAPFHHQQSQQQQPGVSISEMPGFPYQQQQPNIMPPFGGQGSTFFNHMQQAFQGSGQPLVQQQQQSQQPQSSSGDVSDIEKLRKLKQTILSGQHPFFQPVPNPDALASLYLGPHPLSPALKEQVQQQSVQLGSLSQSQPDNTKILAKAQKLDGASQTGSASVLSSAKRPETPNITSGHVSRVSGSLATPQSMSPGAFNSSGSHHQAQSTANGSVGSSRVDHNSGRPHHNVTIPPKSHDFRTSTPSPLPPNSAKASAPLPPQQHHRGSLMASGASGANHDQRRVPPPTSATASAAALNDSPGVNKSPQAASDAKDTILYKDTHPDALSPGGLDRDRERDHDRERSGYLPYDSPRYSQPTDRRDTGRYPQRYPDSRYDRAKGRDWEGDRDRERERGERDRERDRVRDRIELERSARPPMDRRPLPPPSVASVDQKPVVPLDQRPVPGLGPPPEQRRSEVPAHPEQHSEVPMHLDPRRAEMPVHPERRQSEVPARPEQRSLEVDPHIDQHSRRPEPNVSGPTPTFPPTPAERRPEPAITSYSNQSHDPDSFRSPQGPSLPRPAVPSHPLRTESHPARLSADDHASLHSVPSDQRASSGNNISRSVPSAPETNRRPDIANTTVGRPLTGASMNDNASHSAPDRRVTHPPDSQLPRTALKSESPAGQVQGQDDLDVSRPLYPNTTPSGVPRAISRAPSPGPRRPINPSYDASRERDRASSMPSTSYREPPPPPNAAPSRGYLEDSRRQPTETNVPRRVSDNFYPPPPSPVPAIMERNEEVRQWRERERENYPPASYTGPDSERERPRRYLEAREWHGDAYGRERDPRITALDVHPHPRPPLPPPASWDRDRSVDTRDKDKERDGYDGWVGAERKYAGPGTSPIPPRWEDPAIHPHRPLHTRLTDTYDDRFIPREVVERARYPPQVPEVMNYRENPRVRPRSPSPTRRPGVFDDTHRAPKRAREEYEAPSRSSYEYPPRAPPPSPYYDPRAPGLTNARDASPYGRDRVSDPFNRRDMPPPRSPPYYARDRYPPR